MKNFLLIFILIVSMVGTYAQDSKKWYNGIGIRAGVNTSTMAYGRTFNNFTTGFTAGAKYRFCRSWVGWVLILGYTMPPMEGSIIPPLSINLSR